MNNDGFGIFGEVLFDCFNDGVRILGGAPFNVAWHLQAFDQAPLLISRIGDDQAGEQIRAAMQRWALSDAALQTDNEHPTGQVAVSINDGEPSYRILKNQAYDFIDAENLERLDCRVLYHGSLALRHPVSRLALESLKTHHHGKIFMDVNLRSPWWDMTHLTGWLTDADWVKLNVQELQQLQTCEFSLEHKMQRFMHHYQLEGLVVTCGSEGAVAMTAGGESVRIKPEVDVKVVDTVGAGDAFAAVLLLGLRHNWPLSETMQRAQNFASALVGQRGATVQEPEFYQQFVAAWG